MEDPFIVLSTNTELVTPFLNKFSFFSFLIMPNGVEQKRKAVEFVFSSLVTREASGLSIGVSDDTFLHLCVIYLAKYEYRGRRRY